jgi:hypothetical protein
MVEAYLAGWYRAEGYTVIWDERDTWPDLQVIVPSQPQLIECKRITSLAPRRIEHVLKDAKHQLGNTKRVLGGAPLGVLALDISSVCTLEQQAGIEQVVAPSEPLQVIWEALRAEASEVDVILLIWYTVSRLETSQMVFHELRRNVLPIDRSKLWLDRGSPEDHLYKGDTIALAILGALH